MTDQVQESEITKRLENILGPLNETRALLQAQEDDLKAQLEEVRSGIKKIDRVLVAANPQTPAPAKRQSRPETRPSDERIAVVVAAIKEHFEGEEFTANDLADKSGLAKTNIYAVLSTLRKDGRIMRVGNVTQNGTRAFLLKLKEEG